MRTRHALVIGLLVPVLAACTATTIETQRIEELEKQIQELQQQKVLQEDAVKEQKVEKQAAPVQVSSPTPTHTPSPPPEPEPKPAPPPAPPPPEPEPISCLIKGNISYKTGEKIFHVPGCPNYGATKINTSKGERWFCTEAEAVAAGWRKALNCP